MLYGATSRVCCLGGDREGLSSSKVFVWFETFINSNKPLRNLACRRVNPITPSSTGTPVQVSFC